MDDKQAKLEELRFGQQMEKAEDKSLLIKLALDHKCTRAVDLGAGTGFIAKRLSEEGIQADAVDCNFKTDNYTNTEKLTYYPTDLISFVQTTRKTYDCIILSAVLHELSYQERKTLQKGLRRIADKKHCLILIREPYYEIEKNGLIRPFKSLETQRELTSEIALQTPKDKYDEFMDPFTSKLSEVGSWHIYDSVPYPIQVLSLAFTVSYGEQSWQREKHEYRFAFSKQYLQKWCRGILGTDITFTCESYDKHYADFFKKAGYTNSVALGIDYTNCLLAAELKKVD